MADVKSASLAATVWTALVALLGSLVLVLVGAPAAQADTAPPNPATPTTVSTDALPTAQHNGVAWTQVIVGGTVFVGGNFTSARPPGAAAGTSESPRSNLMAYDLATGALLPFAPVLNGLVNGLAASPDGSRLYVGGEFTSVNGQTRYRLAAFDTATLTLVSSFRPALDYRVKAIVATATSVYVGGAFNSAGGSTRTRLAAFSASNGALLNWAPTATGGQVLGMVLSPDLNKIVVAGQFDALNGQQAWGSGALDATTGASLPWAANTVVTNRGTNAGVYSLSTDGTQVYGTGFNFSGTGTLEGSFAASFATGQVVWANGCRGDTYSSHPMGGVLYSVGHPHDCSAIGGHPQENPWTFQYELATTTAPAADGRVNTSGNFRNLRAPELLHFLPTLTPGTFTGQNQAAWSVTGNGQYMTLAGEFTRVNGVLQQGLTRMVVRSAAPNLDGPQGASEIGLTAQGIAPGTVRLSWKAAWDRDNQRLTYELLRGSTVVRSTTNDAAWWNRGTLALTDTTAPAGADVTYRLRVLDPLGNGISTTSIPVTVPSGDATNLGYAAGVLADGASRYWRLGEPSGRAVDWASSDDLTVVGTAQRGVAGALSGDVDRAATFTGGTGVPATTTTSRPGPQTFSVEAWFRTTTTGGGKIVGFGSSSTGASGTYDRHVYMANNGQLVFGVNPGAVRTVTSPLRYNDGQWHHVVASLGTGGMVLSVDGAAVANRTDTTSAQAYTGFWRVAGDAIGTSWPSRPSNTAFAGSVDDVAVYPTALDAAVVGRHWNLGRGVVPNVAPTAAFTTSTSALTASVDATTSSDPDGTVVQSAWSFGDGTTGTGVTTSHTYAAAGTYVVTLVVTDDDGSTGTTTRQVTVAPAPANVAPTAAFTATTGNLSAAVDGAASADPDGSVVSWAWTFGDGGSATGASASHAYAAAGTYPVTLVVTDDDGATGTVSRDVVVTGDYASDTFSRTVTGGLGSADVGGAWTVTGGAAAASVSGGVGRLALSTAGATRTAVLPAVQASDTRTEVVTTLDAVQTGGGTLVSLVGRRVGTNDYRLKVRYFAGGAVTAAVVRVAGSTETVLSQATVPGLTYAPGEAIRMRFDVTGNGTTTLRASVWRDGAAAPAAPLVTTTDSTAAFQGAGSVGVIGYLSTTSTVVPMNLTVDSFTARPVGNG